MINFEEVKNKSKDIDIKYIISKETGLEFKKNKLKQCPFCGSGTGVNGSSGFSVKDNLYKCFSCDEGGDVIRFIERFKNIDYNQTIEYLDGNINITTSTLPIKAAPRVENKTDKEINLSFINYIDTHVDDKEYKEIKSYLDSRRIFINDNDNIHILTNYNSVNQYLKDNFTIERLKKSGLFSDTNNLVFYKHRIIFTHYWNKNIVYLHARTHKQNEVNKYLYLKGSKVPFNLNAINNTYKEITFTEGALDCISYLQDGKLSISLGSTNVTKDTFKFIADKAAENHNKIIVLYDNDKAANKVLTSDKYKEFTEMLNEKNVSYSYRQTKLGDINEAYNNIEFLQDKVQDFYSWCLNIAKNDNWYKVENTEHRETIIKAIDQAYNDVFGIELNTDKTKFRIIDLNF